ncbi:hypothetical protein [Microbispora sp. NPDC049125]|uniref:hypothetical protein n=1 Tax=Microbispora sp. NPDC049125 TaxID=3154929 RepID=UPI003465617F
MTRPRRALPSTRHSTRSASLPVAGPVAVLVAALLATGCSAAATGRASAPAASEHVPAGGRPSTTGATGHGSPTAAKAEARRSPVRVPAGVTAGYVVVDARTGKVTAHRLAHHRFRSASVVKILIALDYLERHKGPIPRRHLALLTPMLRGSDDDAATALWRLGGQGKIVQRVARRLKLADTGPPPAAKPGFWGYTAISAADIALVYRYLLGRAEPRVRDFVLGNLRQSWRCASDGFDQHFGIPRAVPRPWAVKQGWSGFGSVPPVRCTGAGTASSQTETSPKGVAPVDFSRPVLHTTGVIGDRLIMVVLTLQPPGASYTNSAKRVTKLARDLYLSVA